VRYVWGWFQAGKVLVLLLSTRDERPVQGSEFVQINFSSLFE
jgi:hypothetical protein